MKPNEKPKHNIQKIISKDRYVIKIDLPVWKLNKDVEVNVTWASDALNPDVYSAYLKALAYYAENLSADHTYNMNNRFKQYIKTTGQREISVDSLVSYRSELGKDQEHYLGALRGFLRKWHELGYPGVSQSVIELLKGWTLKGNVKGRAVSLMDVNKGPLSDIEVSAIIDALLANYANGKILLSDYVMISVFIHSGRRANQIVSLKIKDILRKKSENADKFIINFPRSKQRDCGWREQFNAYPITEDLWQLIDLHISQVIDAVQERIGFNLEDNTIGELPLFPNFKLMNRGIDTKTLNSQLQFDFYHLKRETCNKVLQKLVKNLQIISERTGSLLNLTSKRFRYTLGTNMAREGKGEYVIAKILDHSDIQSLDYYIKSAPEIVKHIDKAVALKLAPLAQAFQGVLVDSEKDAVRGEDINSRVGDGKGNVGTCGSYGFCNALAPVACYTCTHFQPWLDGPHESVLEELIKKRDQTLSVTDDLKIAAVNDRLILAVSDVVLRCQERKDELRRKKELADG